MNLSLITITGITVRLAVVLQDVIPKVVLIRITDEIMQSILPEGEVQEAPHGFNLVGHVGKLVFLLPSTSPCFFPC